MRRWIDLHPHGRCSSADLLRCGRRPLYPISAGVRSLQVYQGDDGDSHNKVEQLSHLEAPPDPQIVI